MLSFKESKKVKKYTQLNNLDLFKNFLVFFANALNIFVITF